MFIGRYRHTIDEKGRVSIPAKFREELGETVVITESVDGRCLYVFSMDEYAVKFKNMNDIAFSDDDENKAARYMGALSTYSDIDKQGRIIIPQEFRSDVELVRDVVILGAFSRVEIWNSDKWEEYFKETSNSDIRSAFKKVGL
ncbi:MAG: division/cell wall cluster transcriptional repressor MraZ [Eubacteriaceae bacterium]|nr:division/cell wall cluster transcriptional repressor MraZ [Eubacteriaceae bacterium]